MPRSTKVGDADRPGNTAAVAASGGSAPGRAKLIARIWHGQTLANKADEYTKYLYEAGVCRIAAIPGNRGVQMLRAVRDGIADFQVLSYWESLDAIKVFAGDDYEKVSHLPKDPEYMSGMEPMVQHFEVIADNWSRL